MSDSTDPDPGRGRPCKPQLEKTPAGLLALRRWYAEDYRLLEIAEALRQGREPPVPSTRKRTLAQIEAVRPRRKATNKPRRPSRLHFLRR